MAIYRKGKELSSPLHKGKAITQIYRVGNKYCNEWVSVKTSAFIKNAFGYEDGRKIIKEVRRYIENIGKKDKSKAEILKSFIDEQPMLVCSLGLNVDGVDMPVSHMVMPTGICFASNANFESDVELEMDFELHTFPTSSNSSLAGYMAYINGKTHGIDIGFYTGTSSICARRCDSWANLGGTTNVSTYYHYNLKLSTSYYELNGAKKAFQNVPITYFGKVGFWSNSFFTGGVNGASKFTGILYNGKVRKNNELISHLVPHSTNTMIDLVRLEKVIRIGENTANIAYTRNGQPWNPQYA